MIKVVEVLSDTNIGGAGRLLLTRFALSKRNVFEEHIVLPTDSELVSEFKKIGYTPQLFNACKDKSFDLLGIIPLYRYFKNIRPDIVNCHGCLSARIAAMLAKVPVRIYTRHCAFAPSHFAQRKSVKALLGWLTVRISHKIIAVAEAAMMNMTDVGIPENMVKVIINGVMPIEKYDLEKKIKTRNELGIPENAFVCGICARLEECKGIDTMLRAARKLLRSIDDCYFVIVGKGSKYLELRELSLSLGINDRVKFIGFVNDITPYLNCFDLNLNCSRGTETSSLAISEGMSIGLPCVASDWGGNPNMVRNGYNGLIFPTDDFLRLAEHIQLLHDNRELYSEMSSNAYNLFCNEFTATRMTKETEELYLDLYYKYQDSSNPEANWK